MAFTKVNYSYRNRNGQGIWLPPNPGSGLANLAIPNVYQEDATQIYPIGTRFANNERVYHYFKAGGTIAYVLAGIFSNQAMLKTAVNTYGAHVAGAQVLKIDGTSAGSPVADYYQGAYILLIGVGSSERILMRIESNLAAESTSPYAVALTLEQPIPFDISNDVNCEILGNRYASAITAWGDTLLGTMYTCLGTPARKMTSGYYGWVQTWGPAFAARAGTDTTTDADRTVIWNTDGSIGPIDEKINSNYSHQIAGYALAINGTAPGWFYMTVDP